MDNEQTTVVDRYSAGARVNHWITAAALILLALSGFALFHPSLYFLTNLFGGGQWTRILHPFIGVVLALSFLGLFFRFAHQNFLNWSDIKWLFNIRAVIANDDEKLPEVGKYNAGQKIYFWGMTFTILILAVSGVVLWDVYFASYFNIEQKRTAAVAHAAAAVAAVLLWIMHAYAAVWVKGTVRAMMRGNVTGGWAWRHHRRWLKRDVKIRSVPHGPESSAIDKTVASDRRVPAE